MKKFFTNLKAMATRMLVVALVGVAAVSCTEAYDDTDLKAQVAELTERVTELEDRLDEEVVALRALIDAKVAFAEVAEDGAWQFTLSDGESLTLYPEYVENGLTIVTEGGVQYWAKVEGSVVTILTDADGNKVAFHNAPELRVSAEGKIEVSVDGGKSWIATTVPSLFAAIDVKENHACVTLHSGEVLRFALYEEVEFEVQGNALYLEPMGTASAKIAQDGIVEMIVVAAPKGWSAVVDGGILTVTAPQVPFDYDSDNDGEPDSYNPYGTYDCEFDGVVKVLAISKEGKSLVGKLNVSATPNTLKLTIMGNSFTVVNNAVMERSMMGEVMTFPVEAYIGAFLEGEYTVEELAKLSAMDMYTGEVGLLTGYKHQLIRVEANDTASMTIDEAIAACLGKDFKLERGEKLTFFATFPEAKADQIVTATYAAKYVDVEMVANSFKDITIKTTVEGYDYYKLVTFDNATVDVDNAMEFIEYQFSYLGQLENMGYDDVWGVNLTSNYEGTYFFENPNYHVEAALQGQCPPLEVKAGTVYNLFLLPMEIGRPLASYTIDELVSFTFKTKDFAAGGMLTPTITEKPDSATYSCAYGTVSFPAGAYRILFKYYTDEELATFKTPAALAANVVSNYDMIGAEEISINTEYQYKALAAGKSINVVAVAVDQDGKYGEPVTQKLTTKAYEYSTETVEIEDFKLNIAPGAKQNAKNYSFKVKASEGVEKIRFRLITSASDILKYTADIDLLNSFHATKMTSSSTMRDISKYLNAETGAYEPYDSSTSSWSNYYGLNYGKEYVMVIVGQDAEGKATRAAYKHFYAVDFSIINKTAENYATLQPTVTLGTELNTTFTYGEYYENQGTPLTDPELAKVAYNGNKQITIKPAAGTVVYVRFLGEQEGFSARDEVSMLSRITTFSKATTKLSDVEELEDNLVYIVEAETTFNTADFVTWNDAFVNYTWKDADGNFYEDVFVQSHEGFTPEGLPEVDYGTGGL